jgi:hypothetical protein
MMSEDDKQVVVQKTDDEVYRVDDGEILPALTKKEEEEQVPICCLHCMYTPCEWMQFKEEIVDFCKSKRWFENHGDKQNPYSFHTDSFLKMTEEKRNEIKGSHRSYKKQCYQRYAFLKYGRLGRGNRIPLGPCVEDGIRRMFPIHDNSFVGYHSP